MSGFRKGIKLKTATPNGAVLKLLRGWYPNTSLAELRARVQNHDYIYLTDQEKYFSRGNRQLAKRLKELDRAGLEAELYQEQRDSRDPQSRWRAWPLSREELQNSLQADREIRRQVLLDVERETEGFAGPETMESIEEALREEDEEDRL